MHSLMTYLTFVVVINPNHLYVLSVHCRHKQGWTRVTGMRLCLELASNFKDRSDLTLTGKQLSKPGHSLYIRPSAVS